MSELHDLLRRDLTAALRERDRDRVRLLRTVLSAIANAEAQPDHHWSPAGRHSDGAIAGAAAGVGAAEVERRDLTEAEVVAIVAAERDERLASADDLATRGASDAAAALRADAARLGGYLA